MNGPQAKRKTSFVQKQLTKADQKLSTYFTTYQLFRLNYESFSNLCERFLAKKGSFSA